MNFGLIGFPLGHSMSGVIHKELLRISGIDAKYSLIEVDPKNLNQKFNELKELKGFNVTIPHKINIIPLLDGLDEKAKLFSSVNTVKMENGVATGYNTDCYGFLRATKMAGIELNGEALLCGCGGVARTIAFETVLSGANLTIAVRRDDKDMGEALVKEIKDKLNVCAKLLFLDEVNSGYDVLINATPVGMFPKIDDSVLPKEIVKKCSAVFDVIYNPRETKLLSFAKEFGIPCSDGLSMLVWQAVVAEEIWNNIKFTDEEVMEVLSITEKEMNK